jgi:hypothetical protein
MMKIIPYREAVGSVMYLMLGTRPDLANYMREVGQYLSNSGQEHWNAVVRGFKYLHGTKCHCLLLGGAPHNPTAELDTELADSLIAYSDSDYASCSDTRRSIGGFVTMLGRSPISWLSQKHHTVVLSTTEAEYIALCHCMQEVILLKTLLGELGFKATKATTIYEDNQSCIKLANNPELHGRSKHIDIRYHFVQEKVVRFQFNIVYCNTKDMIADIVTKALLKPQFLHLRAQLGAQTKDD